MQTSLQDILNDLDVATSNTVKVASAPAESNKVAEAEQELVAALNRAETQLTTNKTAGTNASPRSDLEKIATDLVEAEKEALQKEANFYGAAVADGFMSRVNMYTEAAANVQKTAGDANIDVEKIAAEAVRGYVETKARMEKEASDEYVRGYNETLSQIEKVASDVFTRGAADCAGILQRR